jgi:DNA gyrase subunit A
MRNLMDRFILSDKQANAILEMKLRRLTSLEVENLEHELEDLEKLIADYKDIIANPARINAIIKQELTDVKNAYNTPRRSEICVDFSEIGAGDLIDREDVVISMTHTGYVKRQPVSEYKAQHRGGVGITAHKTKDEDFVERMFVTCTHDDLLFFSNKGRVYAIKAYEIPEAERTARGRAVVNLNQIAQDEKINAIIPIKENTEHEGYLIMATKNGLVKKTEFAQFESIRKGGKIAISLNEGDELIGVELVDDSDNVLLAASSGKCIRFSTTDVRSMGRDTMGVKSINISGDDKVVDMAIIREGVEQEVFTITENGYGKRTDVSDYRLQSRAGKGVKAGNFNEQTGGLVNLKLISPNDDIMLIADNGIIMRVRATEISKISRDTKGVRIMTLKNEGKVVCAAVTEHEEVDENAENVEGVETSENAVETPVENNDVPASENTEE